MAKKINEIKAELKAATFEMLPFFMEEYKEDVRAGVKALVRKAETEIAKREAELQRLQLMRAYENEYDMFEYICGIDEAGRGPLAGPVVAGAAILPKDAQILYLNDSKKLSASTPRR